MDKIPKTVVQAVDFLLKNVPAKKLSQIKEVKENMLITFHHNLGTSIRNEFGLWAGNKELLADCKRYYLENYPEESKIDDDFYMKLAKHFNNGSERYTSQGPDIHPDDASYVMIKALWKELNKPLDL